jgi:capsular exopolysaccharide synthesis family protein
VASPPSTEPIPVETTSPILILLLGGIVGLGLGGGLVFLLDMLDPTIRIFEDLDKLFEDQDVPLLGLVPGVNPQRGEPVLILDSGHPCNDIYERLRSNLQISGVEVNNGRVPKTVLITSAIAHEGKTTTAYNLGIASARAGRRTLIVEMDFRNASQAWRLGVQPDASAVTEPLRYYGGRLSDPVRMVPDVANLYVSPSVGPQRNPAAVLDASEMNRFLQDIQARFDFIIFDAPHFTGSNDAMLLEPRTDGMIIVSRPGVTQKPIITAMLEQLEEKEDVRLLGAVINGADIPIMVAQLRDDTLMVDEAPATNETEPSRQRKVPVGTPIEF